MTWSETINPNPYLDGILDRHDGLYVRRGLDEDLVDFLVRESRHDSDMLDRFMNQRSANHWYRKAQPRVYSILGRNAMTGLAGAAFFTPMNHVTRGQVPGVDYLFEQRMYRDYVPHGKPAIADANQILASNFEQAALYDFIGQLAADGPTNNGTIGLNVDRDDTLAIQRHDIAGFVECPGLDESIMTMVRTWDADSLAVTGLLRIKRPGHGPARISR